mmetsp:Transcript_72491/g.234545  ORF Transcript_72491/g.234545 Transcript_72491/m.234545 type:complete len:232 (-) Transcript_72491:64-759(-)
MTRRAWQSGSGASSPSQQQSRHRASPLTSRKHSGATSCLATARSTSCSCSWSSPSTSGRSAGTLSSGGRPASQPGSPRQQRGRAMRPCSRDAPGWRASCPRLGPPPGQAFSSECRQASVKIPSRTMWSGHRAEQRTATAPCTGRLQSFSCTLASHALLLLLGVRSQDRSSSCAAPRRWGRAGLGRCPGSSDVLPGRRAPPACCPRQKALAARGRHQGCLWPRQKGWATCSW